MRVVWRSIFVFTLALGLTAFWSSEPPPVPAASGDCARCVTCSQCNQASHGGNSCDYKGGEECPCRETGGNCNPTLTLNLDDGDRRVWDSDAGAVVVARLDGEVFGTWTCEHGDLRVALRESDDGTLTPLSVKEFDRYRRTITLKDYVERLSAQLAQQ